MSDLERYEAMFNHASFCEVMTWSFHPMAEDELVSISRGGDRKWRWYAEENDSKLIEDAPAFDSLLDAFEALVQTDDTQIPQQD